MLHHALRASKTVVFHRSSEKDIYLFKPGQKAKVVTEQHRVGRGHAYNAFTAIVTTNAGATGDPPAKRQKPGKELKTLALQYPNPTVNVVIALPHHYTAFYFFYST